MSWKPGIVPRCGVCSRKSPGGRCSISSDLERERARHGESVRWRTRARASRRSRRPLTWTSTPTLWRDASGNFGRGSVLRTSRISANGRKRRCASWGSRYGQGLQLINILRDAGTDLRHGRCYLPADELQALGIDSGGSLARAGPRRARSRKMAGKSEAGPRGGDRLCLRDSESSHPFRDRFAGFDWGENAGALAGCGGRRGVRGASEGTARRSAEDDAGECARIAEVAACEVPEIVRASLRDATAENGVASRRTPSNSFVT